MKKLMIKLLSVTAILLCANAVYAASMGERSWHFEPGETLTRDFRSALEGQGVEYGCEIFKPSAASFIITYSYPSDITYGIQVIADDQSKVKHDKVNHKFTVTNAKTLDISLPGKGLYSITNTTGHLIEGSVCDSGVY